MDNPFTLTTLSKEKHVYMGLFDFEKWYHSISPFTFDTHFVPLTREEAEAMVVHYQVHQLGHDSSLLTPDYQKIISDAISKLDHHMQDNKHYFVRISTRSPKDAALLSGQQFNDEVKRETINIMKQHGEDTTKAPSANVKQIAVYQTSINAMKVKNGKEAMDLLLQSERIYTDLRPSLTHDDNWAMKFIVREFVPLDVSYEFRGFACNKTLTALTQYNNTCFFPHLQNHEQEIVDKIVEFYGKVADKINYEAYVIDFAIVGDDVKIIEINPFGNMTGASLFSWPHDRKTLQGNMDIYNDNFGIQKNEEDTSNYNLDKIIQETQATKIQNNNVKTILRTVKWVPSFINDEYVESLFYGVFQSNNEKTPEKQEEIEPKDQKCIIC